MDPAISLRYHWPGYYHFMSVHGQKDVDDVYHSDILFWLPTPTYRAGWSIGIFEDMDTIAKDSMPRPLPPSPTCYRVNFVKSHGIRALLRHELHLTVRLMTRAFASLQPSLSGPQRGSPLMSGTMRSPEDPGSAQWQAATYNY